MLQIATCEGYFLPYFAGRPNLDHRRRYIVTPEICIKHTIKKNSLLLCHRTSRRKQFRTFQSLTVWSLADRMSRIDSRSKPSRTLIRLSIDVREFQKELWLARTKCSCAWYRKYPGLGLTSDWFFLSPARHNGF
jgi:hypothetical protein